MSIEKIVVNGKQITTLKQLIRPSLRAVVVGFNPSLKSVEVGHYYQGICFWKQLEKYRIVTELPIRKQDVVAFEQGIGFTDLVRIPTENSQELSSNQIRDGARSLAKSLRKLGETYPAIILRYPHIANRCDKSIFMKVGFKVFKKPSQFDQPDMKHQAMQLLARQISE